MPGNKVRQNVFRRVAVIGTISQLNQQSRLIACVQFKSGWNRQNASVRQNR
jgi:hypothetical protein